MKLDLEKTKFIPLKKNESSEYIKIKNAEKNIEISKFNKFILNN